MQTATKTVGSKVADAGERLTVRVRRSPNDPSSLDELFRITCGQCQVTNQVTDWTQDAFGRLPAGEFQCPACNHAFRRQPKAARQPWEKFVELHPIQPRL